MNSTYPRVHADTPPELLPRGVNTGTPNLYRLQLLQYLNKVLSGPSGLISFGLASHLVKSCRSDPIGPSPFNISQDITVSSSGRLLEKVPQLGKRALL